MSEWFYAKDGQQQGPVSKDELAGLLRDGSIGPQDMVWNASMSDWAPAAKVPELAASTVPAKAPDSPPTDPANPYAVSEGSLAEGPAPEPGVALEEIVPGSEPIDVIACLKRGFDLTIRNIATVILVGLVYFGVTMGASFVFGMLDAMLGFGTATQEFSSSPNGASGEFSFQTTGPFSGIAGNLLSLFLSLGLARVGLNIVSGREVSVGMLFGEGSKFFRALGATILFGIAAFIGILLLIVPGVYIMLRYGQYLNAIVDRDLGIMEAFNYSSSITTNNRMLIFLLWLLSVGVVLAGVIALCVGVLFAYPVVWLMWLSAYRWMQYGSKAVQDQPGTQVPLLAANP